MPLRSATKPNCGSPSILELVRSLDHGGRTVRIAECTSGFIRSGLDVTVASFNPPSDETVRRHPVLANSVTLGLTTRFDFRQVQRVSALIKQRNIALVHAHSEDAYLYGGLAAKWRRIPVIGTFHRSTRKIYEPKLTSRVWNYLLTHQVAVSRDRLELMVSETRTPRNRVSVIWGATDVAKYQAMGADERDRTRRRLGIQQDEFALLGLGHLGPIKGHDLSIRALAHIRATIPGAKLYIGGDGSIEDRASVLKLAAELNLSDRVAILGHVDNAPEWLAACDVFVQPSRDEAFGLVFAEASSAGCAIVASRVGGIPEIVLDGHTGILVPPEDPGAVAQAVVRLLNDGDLRRKLGADARVRALAYFSAEAMTEAYLSLMRPLLRLPAHTAPKAERRTEPTIDGEHRRDFASTD